MNVNPSPRRRTVNSASVDGWPAHETRSPLPVRNFLSGVVEDVGAELGRLEVDRLAAQPVAATGHDVAVLRHPCPASRTGAVVSRGSAIARLFSTYARLASACFAVVGSWVPAVSAGASSSAFLVRGSSWRWLCPSGASPLAAIASATVVLLVRRARRALALVGERRDRRRRRRPGRPRRCRPASGGCGTGWAHARSTIQPPDGQHPER